MNCPNCQNELPEEARVCNLCGASTAKYAPPEGFELDDSSGLYYSSAMGADPETGATVQWVTWFDPHSGEYQQVSYPAENELQPIVLPEQVVEPHAQLAAVPLPEEPILTYTPEPEPAPTAPGDPLPVQQSTASSSPQIPEGFTYDPDSGLYYIATPGTDPTTGAAGQWFTYFYPSNGEYQQVFYPSGAATKTPIVIPGDPKPRGKKNGRAVLVILPLVVLLCGAGFAFWQYGGLSLLQKPGQTEIPEGIEIVEPDPSNAPEFLPLDESASDNADESQDNQNTSGASSAPQSSEEAGESVMEDAANMQAKTELMQNYLINRAKMLELQKGTQYAQYRAELAEFNRENIALAEPVFGLYRGQEDDMPTDYQHELMLFDDLTCVWVYNMYEGMNYFTGTYYVEGDLIYIEADETTRVRIMDRVLSQYETFEKTDNGEIFINLPVLQIQDDGSLLMGSVRLGTLDQGEYFNKVN